MLTVSDAVALIELDRDEQKLAAWIEGRLDTALASFDGSPIKIGVEVPANSKVAYAVQRKYERGGWRVQIAMTPKGPEFVFFTVVTAVSAPAFEKASKELPPVNFKPVTAQSVGTRLLVRMPTRGRPKQAIEVLQKYRDMAGFPVQLEVVIDYDDETMHAPEVFQRLHALGCTITSDCHTTKVEAVNGGRVRDWDILILASDDMVPVENDYALHVLQAMENNFPFLDGAIFFDDGFQQGGLCTLPIIGRRFYDWIGKMVYAPFYRSLSCDNEQTELWTAYDRLKYVDQKIIEHRHHVWGKAPNDATYKVNDALSETDKITYMRRKATIRSGSQFEFDSPPLLFSILICTIPERREMVTRLIDYLYAQIGSLREVEIVVDNGGGTIGEKRQRLLERAKGHFVAFVDDDDFVATYYVDTVLNAIDAAAADVTHLSLVGEMTTDGQLPERFEHSTKYTEWKTTTRGPNMSFLHERTPNHLNPIRRDVALKVGYDVKKHYIEDKDFSDRVLPFLTNEVSLGDAPLYLYFYNTGTSKRREPDDNAT